MAKHRLTVAQRLAVRRVSDRNEWFARHPICPACGGSMDEATTPPNTYAGRCDVYLVCETCGHAEEVGHDTVL